MILTATPGVAASGTTGSLGTCSTDRRRIRLQVQPPGWNGQEPPTPYGPAPSQRPEFAAALAREVELVWVKPKATAPPWLRETFPHVRRRSPVVWAVTLDSRGRVVREFVISPETLAAYAELQRQRLGTCPIEAVTTASIAPGKPAQPAHPAIRAQMDGVEL